MGYIEDFKQMEEVSIENLLEKEKIVVPEIQREYVWGNNKPVLVRFINDINENYNKKMDMNVGFLYSYKTNSSEVYLIDGQQRFTTLILLAFYCSIKDNCISDFRSLLKIKESAPTFSYRVRSYTELFMSSLFKNIDSLDDLNPEKIKCKKWYLSIYENDISIKSMLNALDIIYKHKPSITYGYITSKIKFWYFNVINTSEGEELYITMNSRGETLKSYENIKPMLINECTSYEDKKHYGKLWNKLEEFFYQKKGTRDINSVDTAMDNLILVIFELKNKKEYNNNNLEEINKKISLEGIESYFGILEQLYKTKDYRDEVDRLFGDNDDDKDFLLLKALLIAKDEDRKKMYHIISNCIRRSIVNNIPLLKFLNKYKNQSEPLYMFILNSEKYDKEILHNVFDQHELDKIQIYHDTNDSEIETLFWEAEKFPITKGRLNCIWNEKFCEKKETWNNSDKEVFKKRFEIFKEIFASDNINITLSQHIENNKIDNSLIARALLATDDNYGIHKGANNYSYGYGNDYCVIMNEKYSIISKLVSNVIKEDGSCIYNKLVNIINYKIKKYESDSIEKNAIYYILKYPNSLQALGEGYNILFFESGTVDWKDYRINILNKTRASSYNINIFCYLVYKNLKDENIVNNEWLTMKNGLSLDCATTHGWIIKYDKNKIMNEQLNEIKKLIQNRLSHFQIKPCTNDVEDGIFYIDIDKGENLIENGVIIIELLSSITIK